MKEALLIHVKGIVQGVGFRPFVYRMAKKYLIDGWVLNAADGVTIFAEGEPAPLDQFVIELSEHAPAAAQVDEIDLKEVPVEGHDGFEIRFSDEGAVKETTLVSPDLATCEDCARELFNPNDRRYRYPFINCTNCGPRFTIIEELPYDRPRTSMAPFQMCSRCAAEYADPGDRRFHAQPDACFDCGPAVSWHVSGSEPRLAQGRQESDAIFAEAVGLLMNGKILAVKGLGGFHLVCDARNPQAVATLRERKGRDGKAFAVMMPDVPSVREVCDVSPAEEALLTGAQRPIVLLRKRADADLTAGVADRLPELGVMLPYTPVQHILLRDFAEAWLAAGNVGAPMLVMTSGNRHDEPIVISDEEAVEKLSGIADAILGNNRPILTRFDDSVARVLSLGADQQAIQFLRRARGYAPMPLRCADATAQLAAAAESAGTQSEGVGEGSCTEVHYASAAPSISGTSESLASPDQPAAEIPIVFATGPEQKVTFTLLRGTQAFVSQHIGDVEDVETYDAWLAAKQRYEELFDAQPTALACDLHPEYLTSKWAHSQALPVTEVQHHQAHVVSAMAEHGLDGPVAGFAFDGTGYGPDGAIWGGEVLLCNLGAYERFANFAYVPMPGGAAAVRHPLRMAYGVLWAYDLLGHPGAADALAPLGDQAQVCESMIEQGINTPMTSSVGRLFDAASALLGICIEPTYEGEAAILLEAAMQEGSPTATASADNSPYAIEVVKNTATAESTAEDTSVLLLDAAPAFAALLDDRAAGVPVPVIARRFHDAFVDAIVTCAELVRGLYGIGTVVLSGGVFMNRYLVEHAVPRLGEAGFTVALNRDLPPNDGCISLGQAVVTWAKTDGAA